MFRRDRPRRGPRVGGVAHMVVGAAAALLGAFAAAACGSSRGLVLGLAPADADAGVIDVGALDAGATDASLGAVVLVGQATSAQHGGTSGSPYLDTCPDNQAVIGYQGFLTTAEVGAEPDPFVGGIGALCGSLLLEGASPDRVTVAAGAMLAVRGDGRDSPWTEVCAADEVVVGFTGNSGAALDRIAIVCAPLLLTRDPVTGAVAIATGTTTTSSANGGGGGSPYQDGCAASQIARGSNARTGSWVDAFGLVCGTPTIVP